MYNNSSKSASRTKGLEPQESPLEELEEEGRQFFNSAYKSAASMMKSQDPVEDTRRGYNDKYEDGRRGYNDKYEDGRRGYNDRYEDGRQGYNDRYEDGRRGYNDKYDEGRRGHNDQYDDGRRGHNDKYEDGRRAYNDSRVSPGVRNGASRDTKSTEPQWAPFEEEGRQLYDKMSKSLAPELKEGRSLFEKAEREGMQFFNKPSGGERDSRGNAGARPTKNQEPQFAPEEEGTFSSMAQSLYGRAADLFHHHNADTPQGAPTGNDMSRNRAERMGNSTPPVKLTSWQKHQQSLKQSADQNRIPAASGFQKNASAPSELMKTVLAAHNEKRSLHDAPPLTWCDNCYEQAKKQANLCQRKGRSFHGNLGENHDQGQNIFYRSPAIRNGMDAVNAAIDTWYSEVEHPGYDFRSNSHDKGADHFTQLVWKSTTSVGMAISDNGLFVVANYLPAGNLHGDFQRNVSPEISSHKSAHHFNLFGRH